MIPGEIVSTGEPVEINVGLDSASLHVTNTGDVPIHLTAHFHLFEANPRLAIDRRRAFGMRLDVPATGSVRFEPGETGTIKIVPITGNRIIRGFSGVIDGSLDETNVDQALKRLIERGFIHEPT